MSGFAFSWGSPQTLWTGKPVLGKPGRLQPYTILRCSKYISSLLVYNGPENTYSAPPHLLNRSLGRGVYTAVCVSEAHKPILAHLTFLF